MRPYDDTKRVFACSKYAGDVERNLEIARRLCALIASRGHAPFAPHLLYTQFLDDAVPGEGEHGISLGLRFLEVCNELWAYTGDGISDGMRKEIARAAALGVPVVEVSEADLCVQT